MSRGMDQASVSLIVENIVLKLKGAPSEKPENAPTCKRGHSYDVLNCDANQEQK